LCLTRRIVIAICCDSRFLAAPPPEPWERDSANTGAESNGSSRPADPVRAVLDDPPSWLLAQIGEYRTDPDRHKNPISTAIAVEVFGTAQRWREVLPIVETEL
jgi:hypothetical protein